MSGYDQGRAVESILSNTDPIAAVGIIDWRHLSNATLDKLSKFSTRYTGKNNIGALLIDDIAYRILLYRATGRSYDLYSLIAEAFSDRYTTETYASMLRLRVQQLENESGDSKKLKEQLNYESAINQKLTLDNFRMKAEIESLKRRLSMSGNENLKALEAENDRLRDLLSEYTSSRSGHANTIANEFVVDNSSSEYDMTYEDELYSTAKPHKPKAYVKLTAFNLDDPIVRAYDENGERINIKIIG